MKLKFFELARKLSQNSDYNTHKLGAVITRGNTVKGLGFNKKKTHPKSNTRFNNIHAELAAVLNAQEDISGCEIYVYRSTKMGHLAMAKPCQFCEQILRQAGIKTVYYSTEVGYKEEQLYA